MERIKKRIDNLPPLPLLRRSFPIQPPSPATFDEAFPLSLADSTAPGSGFALPPVITITQGGSQTQHMLRYVHTLEIRTDVNTTTSSHANVPSSNRPVYCPVKSCSRSEGGKGFTRKIQMFRHGLVHQGPGYICPFCPEREHKYPRPDNLQRCVLTRPDWSHIADLNLC